MLAVLIALLAFFPGSQPGRSGKPPLVVYCGAGIRAPVEATAKEYQKEFGVSCEFQFGPSHTLLAQIELSKQGDLYLPGDDSHIELAREKGLVEHSAPLARMSPALAVGKGNPKNIRALEDLLRPEVRLGQSLPETSAAGRLVKEALQKSGHWERIKARTIVSKATVSDIANDIRIGAIDAGFVWDVLVTQYPDLELVPVPQFTGMHALVTVSTLKSSSQSGTARHFLRYLAASDKGLKLFKENGFEPVEGELWSETR